MSKVNDLFQKKLHIVNFGIESFYEDLTLWMLQFFIWKKVIWIWHFIFCGQ